MRRIALNIALVLLAASAGVAQAPATPTYRIPLSVVDEKGASIEELSASEVKVQVGHERANIVSVRRYHNAPVRMVIVLDESGSMQGHWSDAMVFIVELLKTLPPNSSVGLIGAGDKPGEVITHPESIINALKNAAGRGPHGHTALWDNVDLALRALPHPRPTDLIIVVSDGGDNASKTRPDKLRKQLLAAGVRVSGILLVDDFGATLEEQMGPSNLIEIVGDTGGREFNSPPFMAEPIFMSGPRANPVRYGPLLANFFRTLYDFHMVEFTLSTPLAKAQKIKVEVQGGHRSIAAPKLLNPPAQP